jgi:hypothetical protein
MKKIIFTLLILSFFGCEKDAPKPTEPVKNLKSGLFRLEFHGADTVKLTYNYLVDTHPIAQKTPMRDTVKVFEFDATEGQNIQAYLNSTVQHQYWKQIRAIWMGDTVYYVRQHSAIMMNITL